MGVFKSKNSSHLSPKSIRLPSGSIFDCGRKVLIHEPEDLRYVCTRLNIPEDEKFFIITKHDGERCLIPIFYPLHPNILNYKTSKQFITYHLCEQLHLKCIQLSSPQDCSDVKLVNDFIIANKNQLNTSEEDSKALNELLNSEEMVTRLLSVLLSIPELTTHLVHVKDHKGKLYQIEISKDGLRIHQEFVESSSTQFTWQDMGNASASRSTVTLPVYMTANKAEKLADFIAVKGGKSKQSGKLKKKKTEDSKANVVQPHGDNADNTPQQYNLKFRLSDSKAAKRLAIQLYTIHNTIIQTSSGSNNSNNNAAVTTRQCNEEKSTSEALTRFNRQFRDTFRCFSRPFLLTSKSYKSKRRSTKGLNDKGDAAVKQESNTEGNTTVQVVQSSISSPSVVTSETTPAVNVTTPTSNITPVSTGITDDKKMWKYPAHTTPIAAAGAPTSTVSSMSHTTFTSHSKIVQPNIIQANYENVSPVVIEPVEVAAAGEAQAELDERDEQVLHSLLMNKAPTIVSSVPVNNFSYSLSHHTSMTPVTTLSSSTFVSHSQTTSSSFTNQSTTPVVLSSFNNTSPYTAVNKSNSTLHTDQPASSMPPQSPSTITTTTMNNNKQQPDMSKQSVEEVKSKVVSSSNVFSSTISSNTTTSNHSSSLLNGSLTPTKISEPSCIPPISPTVQPKSETTTGMTIPNTQSTKLTTPEHISAVTASTPSPQPLPTHSVSVVTTNTEPLTTVNKNNTPDAYNTDSQPVQNVQRKSQLTSLYAPQPYEAVTDNKTHSAMSTSDSFQSRIKPPSITVKSSTELTKQLSTLKMTTTAVKIEESTNNSKHVENNNSTLNTSLQSSENNKINNITNSPNPPVLCSASVSVSGIRPPSGIKPPSITPDKIKSLINTSINGNATTTNGHTNSTLNTSFTSTYDKSISRVEQTPEPLKRNGSTSEDNSQHPLNSSDSSKLPKPISNTPSPTPGSFQSKIRPPVVGNLPTMKSGIPPPSVLPPSISQTTIGQSHLPVPTNTTNIPLPSGIKPPSRSPRSALAK
ncbi:unnamed protein product [Trichobilharzia szidati]|nr:unnamed protein product [Trichobilharzia szidati]